MPTILTESISGEMTFKDLGCSQTNEVTSLSNPLTVISRLALLYYRQMYNKIYFYS